MIYLSALGAYWNEYGTCKMCETCLKTKKYPLQISRIHFVHYHFKDEIHPHMIIGHPMILLHVTFVGSPICTTWEMETCLYSSGFLQEVYENAWVFMFFFFFLIFIITPLIWKKKGSRSFFEETHSSAHYPSPPSPLPSPSSPIPPHWLHHWLLQENALPSFLQHKMFVWENKNLFWVLAMLQSVQQNEMHN